MAKKYKHSKLGIIMTLPDDVTPDATWEALEPIAEQAPATEAKATPKTKQATKAK